MNLNALGEKIGFGWVAEVYARDNKAIKVYKNKHAKQEALYEALINSIVEMSGLPIPKVFGVNQIDEKWAIEMELLKGSMISTYVEQDPDELSHYLNLMADLHIRVHNVKNLPVLISQKKRLKEKILKINLLDEGQKEALITALDKKPDMNCLCHGDFHYNNLIVCNNEIYIIDWVDAVLGDPAADVCRTYMVFKLYYPDTSELYLEIYSSKSGIPVSEIKAWLPFIASARLDERNNKEFDQLLKWIEF